MPPALPQLLQPVLHLQVHGAEEGLPRCWQRPAAAAGPERAVGGICRWPADRPPKYAAYISTLLDVLFYLVPVADGVAHVGLYPAGAV